MGLDKFTSIKYTCPKCRQEFSFTFGELLVGDIKCPHCERTDISAYLDEPTRKFTPSDKMILSLTVRLNHN